MGGTVGVAKILSGREQLSTLKKFYSKKIPLRIGLPIKVVHLKFFSSNAIITGDEIQLENLQLHARPCPV
jgi:hypothetical protein